MEQGVIKWLRRYCGAVERQRNMLVEAVWRAIIGSDTPKREDGELIIQGAGGPEIRYYFRYKGQDAATLTIKEIMPGKFSYFIQSESVTMQDVMENLREAE